jgi:hypothetical protein
LFFIQDLIGKEKVHLYRKKIMKWLQDERCKALIEKIIKLDTLRSERGELKRIELNRRKMKKSSLPKIW